MKCSANEPYECLWSLYSHIGIFVFYLNLGISRYLVMRQVFFFFLSLNIMLLCNAWMNVNRVIHAASTYWMLALVTDTPRWLERPYFEAGGCISSLCCIFTSAVFPASAFRYNYWCLLTDSELILIFNYFLNIIIMFKVLASSVR